MTPTIEDAPPGLTEPTAEDRSHQLMLDAAAGIRSPPAEAVGMGFKFKPKYERYYKRYTIPSNKFKANGDLTSHGVKHLKILQKLKTSKVLGHLLGISILNKHAKSAKPSVIKAGKFMIKAMKHITRHLKGK